MAIKVALVGCGFMGRMHANVYSQLPNADLIGVVDQDLVKAKAFAAEFGVPVFETFEAALESSADAIDICLPTDLHAKFTIEAAAAKKHIMCEKPMALNLAEAESMRDAARNFNVRLMIGHCIRFWPEYAYLKNLVVDGRLGKLLSVNLTRYGAFPSWSSENWLADEARSGGGALDMHIHDTDFAMYLLGEPQSVHSFGTQDARGISQIFTTLTYGAQIVHLEGGWNLPSNAPFKHAFRAIFEKGAAIMDAGPLTIFENGKDPLVPEFAKMDVAGGGNISDLGGYYHELKYFVDCLESGNPFVSVTPETSIASLALALQEISLAKQASA